MPKPKNQLPTLREKLASFDGAIDADDIARLLQTSRHTIYLWVEGQQDSSFPPQRQPEVRPCADRRLDRLHQLNPKKASTVREDEARIIPVLQIEDARAICAVAAVVNVGLLLCKEDPCYRSEACEMVSRMDHSFQ
jgi:hypothetical protein